ncbi:hypothetical protein DICVIV_06834 [Dictyocaulus viviparus]|uniref:Uncharacterized protein n=1 Tax=Dictyocaulus viviparus TaxID=29172 RepID=A0A0D8XTI0_DICVI|nr:hypothetical protein DICVIV_06834 [Dictyocaulus viviparus]
MKSWWRFSLWEMADINQLPAVLLKPTEEICKLRTTLLSPRKRLETKLDHSDQNELKSHPRQHQTRREFKMRVREENTSEFLIASQFTTGKSSYEVMDLCKRGFSLRKLFILNNSVSSANGSFYSALISFGNSLVDAAFSESLTSENANSSNIAFFDQSIDIGQVQLYCKRERSKYNKNDKNVRITNLPPSVMTCDVQNINRFKMTTVHRELFKFMDYSSNEMTTVHRELFKFMDYSSNEQEKDTKDDAEKEAGSIKNYLNCAKIPEMPTVALINQQKISSEIHQ